VKGKTKTVNSKTLLTDAYELTKSAETIDDFATIIEMCERALAAKLPEANAKYANSLAAWAYNRRGEKFAEEAATLVEKGEDRKANELDAMALDDFQESLKYDGKKWKSLHNRGVSLGLHGKYEQSLKDFDQVISLKPDFASVWYNRAEVRATLGRYDNAVEDYAKALELTPGDVGILVGRGAARYRLQKYDESLADFGAALAIRFTDAAALAGRGPTRRWKGASGRRLPPGGGKMRTSAGRTAVQPADGDVPGAYATTIWRWNRQAGDPTRWRRRLALSRRPGRRPSECRRI
jgi:tetratricopeptide (TPR) repeat protein